MVLMAEKKQGRPRSPENPTGRRFKNVGIPEALYEEVRAEGLLDDRSVNWCAKQALAEWLQRRRVSRKAKPAGESKE